MKYDVVLSNKAVKSLKQIDRYQVKMMLSWIKKNLDGCENPRTHGKALTGSKHGYWRYRVGSYRLIGEIIDSEIRIEIVQIAHRKEVYN